MPATDVNLTAPAAKILVIDASDDLQSALPAQLPGHEASYIYARLSDVPDALQRHDFAAVVADIHAPDRGDIELLRSVRQTAPDAKVIVVSSARHAVLVPALMRQRAFGLLIRPVAPTRLADAIDLALNSGADWEEDIELLSGTRDWVQVRIVCKLEAAERAAMIFREVSGELEGAELDEFSTAFREMLMNAIEHGGHNDPSKSIFVNYVWTQHALVFYIRDPGPGFSMNNLPHAAISNPEGSFEHAEVRQQKGIRPGGFGILLAKNLVDELIYSERGNEVILIKHRRPRTVA
jgi:DNA-binding NarL/FixJ family response regulator